MPYLMRGRNEAAVYVEHDVSLHRADAFIRDWNQAHPDLRIDVFHLATWALRQVLDRYPTMQRFVAGGRLYVRRGIWFSYAIKAKLEQGAPLLVVKRRFDLDESFAAMVEGMRDTERAYRSGEAARVDRELGLLLAFPGFVRRVLLRLVNLADRFGMPAVYHHLYEYGTVGIFCSLGRPVTEPGGPTSGPNRRRTMNVRWTYDERAEDGLTAWFAMRRFAQVVEDPGASALEGETAGPDAERAVGTLDDAARS